MRSPVARPPRGRITSTSTTRASRLRWPHQAAAVNKTKAEIVDVVQIIGDRISTRKGTVGAADGNADILDDRLATQTTQINEYASRATVFT